MSVLDLYIANKPVISAGDLSLGNLNSDAIPAKSFTKGGFIINWSGLTGTLNGTYNVEVSNDGVIWEALTSPITMGTATGKDAFDVNNLYYAYFRVAILVVGITAGTVNCSVTLKV